jgi:phosphohistidine phosphatase
MIIVLFRHGPAGRRDPSRWPDDGQRPLTERGVGRTQLGARGLAHVLPEVSVILTSPLTRALQTAKLLDQELEAAHGVEKIEALSPGHSYRAVLKRLEACGASEIVVLVGHEPDLGKLAGMLLFGAPATGLPLKKAGAALIVFVGPLKPGEGRLTAFLPPRMLRRLRCKRSKV